MTLRINQDELIALRGIPHLSRLVYIFGIRPYLDYKTGIVGIKRRISYQSIREELYVEPHVGYKTEQYNRSQIRRAIQRLEKEAIIAIQSECKKLIIKCLLVCPYTTAQNKAVIFPHPKAAIFTNTENADNPQTLADFSPQATRDDTPQAATPLYKEIINKKIKEKVDFELSIISDNFIPSDEVIAKAQAHGLEKANDKTDLLKFISHNKSCGNVSVDWNEKYLGWLIKGQEIAASKKIKTSRRKPHASKQTVLDKVRDAYKQRFDFDERTQSFIAKSDD